MTVCTRLGYAGMSDALARIRARVAAASAEAALPGPPSGDDAMVAITELAARVEALEAFKAEVSAWMDDGMGQELAGLDGSASPLPVG